jgi:hypothetical protein
MQIKLAAGPLTLEYDGDETFFSQEVAKFVSAFFEQTARLAPVHASQPGPSGKTNGGGATSPLPSHSTNTVAKLLNVQTGPDLIMAAVAKHILVDGNQTVSRQVIMAEMRKASSYYKKTFTSNLSNYLDNLTKADNLRLVSEGVYGLPAKMRDVLGPKLNEQ